MSAAEKILIVEDDAAIAEMVQARLEREGFSVHVASDGESGLKSAQEIQPSLILLDLTMPKLNGLEVCRRVREGEKTRKIPIIIVTANAEDSDVTVGLEMGADDYVSKPFSVRQLVARVRAVLRRSAPSGDSVLTLGSLTIDSRSHEARISGEQINLTLTEFGILAALASEAGRVFSREELLEKLDKQDDALVKRNIDVHIMTLRKKMGVSGDAIVTVRGIGYKLRP